jgi:hypothetical protein
MSSLEDFVNRMEKSSGTATGSGNITEKAVHEFLNPHSLQIDEKGKPHKIDNIATKTELYTPAVFTTLEVMTEWLKEEFPLGGKEDAEKTYLEMFDFLYKINMVSKDRKSRQEVVQILNSLATQENEDTKNLTKELSKI